MAEPGAERLDPVVRRNFVLNVVDGALFSFAISLASRSTVLPLFVQKIGGGNVAVGLVPVVWLVGFSLPQIFVANYAQQAPSKKRVVMRTAFLQRLPWLLLAVLAYYGIEAVSLRAGLLMFFVVFGLAAVAGSLNLPPWFDLMAKITPVRLRGRLLGMRTLLGGGLGILAGFVAARVLEAMAFPDGFALLFGLAFAVMVVSYGFLAMVREEVRDEPGRPVAYGAFLRGLPGVLRRSPNYRNFLVADALALAALMGEAFYTVDAFARFELPEAYAGRFTVVVMASTLAGSAVFGPLGDRYGHRVNMVLAAVCTALGCLAARFAPTVEVYALAFVGAAFTTSLRAISLWPLIAELCGEADRPTYVALSSLLTSPFVLSGLAAGYLADRAGYDLVFVLAAALAVAAALWLVTMVREPRRSE